MDFKVQRVPRAKPPSVLVPASSDSTQKRLSNDKDNPSQSKSSVVRKPKIPGKHGDASHQKSEAGSDLNKNKQVNSDYTYAGVEFRPLEITDEGGISTAIVAGSKSAKIPQNELKAYEEVTIHDGEFDKINPGNILLKSADSGESNSALKAFTADMQQPTHEVHSDTHTGVDNHQARKKPPPMPKPYSKARDNVDATDGGKKKPPPLPKPYSAHKDEEPSEPSDEVIVNDVYAVVNKSAKQQILADEPKAAEDEPPPPLPSRPNFEADDEVKKSQEDLTKEEPQQEKISKGSGIMSTIKKHIRQKSDGGQTKKITEKSKEHVVKKNASNEALNEKPNPPIKAYLVTDIVAPSSTKVVAPPSTQMFGEPEMYESVTDGREEEILPTGATDLPDGWQEVKDSGETYYWHVASGTTQWEKPKKLEGSVPTNSSTQQRPPVIQQKPKSKPESKTVTSFPVHSMGWLQLEESQVAPHNMSDTIAECIGILARERKDLWKTAETWGGGKDLRLLLESDNLKLVDCQSKATLLVQPISKMRVWGAGREEQKDFAYVARDQVTGKHKCHVFRCHGTISGRAIHNKLHEMCNKILEEKKKARETQQNGSTQQWSDIINTPPKSSARGRKWSPFS